jgi:hypothetical protein
MRISSNRSNSAAPAGQRSSSEPLMKTEVAGMMRVALALTIALGVLVIHPSGQSPVQQLPNVRHYSGENVAPVFEGWERNTDGSYNFVFGYLNRNYEEEPEIPIGAVNNFSPGPADRGQPTHFYPRRQQFMFKVHVPADFGKQELVWTLTRNGRTEKAVAHLALEWELTEIVYSQNRAGLNRDSVTAKPNQPPKIVADSRAPVAAVAATPVALSFAASDDGQPAVPAPRPAAAAARRSGPPPEPALINIRQGPVQQQIIKPSRQGLMVTWTVWRGAGQVRFDPPSMVVKDGKATTQATFSAPGAYVIRAFADDGVLLEGGDVTVNVAGDTKSTGR